MTPFTILLVGGGIILLLIIVGIVVSITSERSLVDERLGKYLEDEDAKQQQEEQKQPATSVITDWLNNRVEASSFGDRIARDLARADIKFKVGEYFAMVVGVVV